LHTESEWYESTSDNIIAEITGSELPNEVLVLGGHFDSWDTGS
jgi:carboxypeptidase Q